MSADIVYDTEFLERGYQHPIDLISIGMAGPDGAELYMVSNQFDRTAVAGHEWLMANVVPSLPITVYPCTAGQCLVFDATHPDAAAIASRAEIAAAVKAFVLGYESPRLWAWYGDYDHVVLSQLFGTMAQLPEGFPMLTHDIKQEANRLGNPPLPVMPDIAEHKAIDDARLGARRLQWLKILGEQWLAEQQR